MKTITARTLSDLESFFPLILLLRPHLTLAEFIDIYQNAHKNDQFELTAFFDDEGEMCAIVGYRILYDFVRGRHLYIDDLVTHPDKRSQGLGQYVLKYAEVMAKQLNCKGGLRLCAGLENTRGISFYERNGWTQRALAFVKK